MKVSILGTLILALTVSLQVSAANPQCKTINCDCSALGNDAWKSSCQAQEQQLIARCQSGKAKSISGSYCLVSGPAASPVALALSAPTAGGKGAENKEEASRKVASLLWALREDLGFALDKLNSNQKVEAMQVLAISNENVRNLYAVQTDMTSSVMPDDERGARKSWRDFAKDVSDLANFWSKSLADLVQKNAASKDPKEQAKLNEFLTRALVINGEQYELSATGYANAGNHGKSALMWKAAADNAKTQLDNAKGRGDLEQQKFLRYLAATRLNRASYHSAMDDNNELAQEMLMNSQQMATDQKFLDAILNAKEDDAAEPTSSPHMNFK